MMNIKDHSEVVADRPMVSVVTPFLNAERFLEEAIASVLAQTYDRWELLLVDDGSTDASTEIAQQYAYCYPAKIRYLEHEGHRNQGASAARNLGIRHATGSYIAYLDADDVWLPHKLEQQLAILRAHPEVGMICGASEDWYSWTGHPEDADRDIIKRVGAPLDQPIQPPRLLTLVYPLGKGDAPSLNTVLVRAEIVRKFGEWEETFRVVYTDQVFLAKIYLHTTVYVASDCWDRYRQHPGSSVYTVKSTGRYDSARYRYLNWIEGYLSRCDYEGTEMWRMVQDALWPYQHPILFFLIEYFQHPVKGTKAILIRALRQVMPAYAYRMLRARFSNDPIAAQERRATRPVRSTEVSLNS